MFYIFICIIYYLLQWRNWIARVTSNHEVVGSSPTWSTPFWELVSSVFGKSTIITQVSLFYLFCFTVMILANFIFCLFSGFNLEEKKKNKKKNIRSQRQRGARRRKLQQLHLLKPRKSSIADDVIVTQL